MPLITPNKVASYSQIRALLERIVNRGMSRSIKPKVELENRGAMESMLPSPPIQTREYGQLADLQNTNSSGPRISTHPIEEAMAMYAQDPSRYRALNPGPEAKQLYLTSPGGPEDASGALGLGIASEQMKFRKPIPPGMESITRAIGRELGGVNEQMPIDPVKAFTNKIQGIKGPEAKKFTGEELADVAKKSLLLEDLWQSMGGARSGSGQLWKKYWETSDQRHNIKTVKDYFVTSAIRYETNPVMFERKYPREKKVLDGMREAYKKESGFDILGGE